MSLESFDWSLCRVFLAILRTGSLSAAARRLRTSHPAVRRHLSTLEAALGAPLFTRSPRGLTPTALAQGLVPAAEAMEAAAGALLRAARAEAETVAGVVRIAASEVMGTEVLPPMLAALRARRPALTFELALSDAPEDILGRGADLAVRMARPTQGGLVARSIGAVEIGLFAHRDWVAAHGAPERLADLRRPGTLIGQDRRTSLADALAAAGLETQPEHYALRVDSDLAQMAALRAGLGVGTMQRPLAARDPALVRVLPDHATTLEIWLVTHPDLRTAPQVRATLDALGSALNRYVMTAA
jgi:DNA-binding transcriptional LysR family regulator